MEPEVDTKKAFREQTELRREPAMTVDDLTRRNIELIAELDAVAQSRRTLADRLVDGVTGFCGRMAFVYVHMVWFSTWMIINQTHLAHFDPYPFNLLTLLVALEAIFLSTFILISQNRQGRLAERRAHLDLQINLLSEQENTKILSMLASIQMKLGIPANEQEVQVLMESTQPENMIRQIEDTLQN